MKWTLSCVQEKPYMCDHCKTCFADRGTWRNHVRIHTGERPYKCTLCDKSFVQRTNLQAHIKTHTDERPFPCQVHFTWSCTGEQVLSSSCMSLKSLPCVPIVSCFLPSPFVLLVLPFILSTLTLVYTTVHFNTDTSSSSGNVFCVPRVWFLAQGRDFFSLLACSHLLWGPPFIMDILMFKHLIT